MDSGSENFSGAMRFLALSAVVAFVSAREFVCPLKMLECWYNFGKINLINKVLKLIKPAKNRGEVPLKTGISRKLPGEKNQDLGNFPITGVVLASGKRW